MTRAQTAAVKGGSAVEMPTGSTKEAIIEAAIELFTAKGFKGTTIRDIAGRAHVNVANISYYYQGKQGLLEACLVHFFEPYLQCLETETRKLDWEDPVICLHRAIRKILVFQSEHHLLTRLVWRETSIDSQTSREILSTYMMKERFYFKALADAAFGGQQSYLPLSMMVIQLKGILATPYLNSQYVSEVWGMHPKDPYFVEKYYTFTLKWLQSVSPVPPLAGQLPQKRKTV